MSNQIILATAKALPVSRETELARGSQTETDAATVCAATVYLAGLAAGSRRTMQGALQTVADIVSDGSSTYLALSWGELRFQHTHAVRSVLAERYAVATANKIISALKGCLKAAWRLGLMPTDEYGRAVDLAPVRGSSLPKGRALKAREVDKLLDACEQGDSNIGARDGAILSIALGAGLRRSEIVALDLSDYDAGSGEIRVRSGKGNKERITYAGRDARGALNEYLEKRGLEAGPLFLPTKRGRPRKDGARPSAVFELRRLSDQAVWDVVKRQSAAAGIKAFAPHDTRRTWASELLDAGADIATVQKLAGHANPATTARYDRRGEKAKKAASELIRLGGQRK